MQSATTSCTHTTSIRSTLADLVSDAVRVHGAEPETARIAAAATERALIGRMRTQTFGPDEVRRVRAYFGAVLRSQSFKRARRGDAHYRNRIKVATLVDDLRSVGMPAERIREEVASFFGEQGLQLLEVEAVA